MNQSDALRGLQADFVYDRKWQIYSIAAAIEIARNSDISNEDYLDYNDSFDIAPCVYVVDIDDNVIWTAVPNRMVIPCSELLGNDSSPLTLWKLLAFMADNWENDMQKVRVNYKGVVSFQDEVLALPVPGINNLIRQNI